MDTKEYYSHSTTWSLLNPCYFIAGLLCDLMWADPDIVTEGWGESDRGISYTFGDEIVSDFLRKHDLDVIVRSNQVLRIAVGCYF